MAQATLMKWVKRPREDVSTDDASPSKRAKIPENPSDQEVSGLPSTLVSSTSSGGKSQLSKEQRERMNQSRLAALSKREEKVASEKIGPSWKRALAAEFQKPYYLKLQDFLRQERSTHTIYPPEADVFSWTQLCRIEDVKVVILGQDPYHNVNQAHGLCFSVKEGVSIPPSLQNMYQELANDIEGFQVPNHGCLTSWAKQGVLLLNAVLTVREHSANSHQNKGWELFTDAVIRWLNANLTGVVFLLWGGNAQKKGKSIDKKKHHVLQCPHPSPLSVYRGFFGCKHFSQANSFLERRGKEPIDWTSVCDKSAAQTQPKTSTSLSQKSTPASAPKTTPTKLYDPTQEW